MAEEDTQAGGDASAAAEAAPAQPAPAQAAPQADRRNVQRYIAHWRAALVSVSDGVKRYLGTTDNICESGVAISCDDSVPTQKDYHVYLEIPQPGGKAPIVLQMQGKVVHASLANKRFKIGVIFKQFHGDSKETLASIMRSGKLKKLSMES